MKIEILQENLNKALTIAGRIISSRPQIPLLSHFLFQASKNELTLTASNLETTIIIPIGAKIETEGKFTVPAKTFQEIVSSLSAEKITLNAQEGTISIKSGNFQAKINGTGGSDYPNVVSSDAESANFIEIPAPKIVSAISHTAFSAALDESRAVLTGILIKPKGKDLTFVSTDGFRLSVVTVAGDFGEGITEAITLPARTLNEVAKIISENKEAQLKISFLKSNQILIKIGDLKIYSSLISGNFPDYEKIIPSNNTTKIIVSTQEFSKTIRLASVFARDSANIVKMKIENGKLKITANAAQVGENESEIDVDTLDSKNEELQIAFNYRYLLDFLNCLSDEKEISLEFSAPTSPGIFRPVSDKNFLHIIMPVRVQN